MIMHLEIGQRVNFVDDNILFVGYDLGSQCCEWADWFIADTLQHEERERENDTPDLSGYVFDRDFFKELPLGDGGMVIFRMVNGDKEKYLHLFNCHNGYYSHGFTFSVGEDGQGIREGQI